MLPIKHQSIFKSRWIAMLWAAGIIWSAVEFTGGLPGGNDADANQSAADASAPTPAANGDDGTTAALVGVINTLQGMK